MNDDQRKGVIVVGLACALLWVAYTKWPAKDITPDILPTPGGPDFLTAFAQTDDQQQAGCDAEAFAGICEAVADVLEYDGKQASPRIDTGVKIDDLRRWIREYALDGGRLKGRYPAVADAAKDYLDKHAGTSGGQLDAATRERWVKSLRDMGQSARYAAGRLR